MSYLNSLPEEILIEIIYHINDYKDLLAIYEINKNYFNVKFWTSLFYNHFGNIIRLLAINFNASFDYLMILYSKVKWSYLRSLRTEKIIWFKGVEGYTLDIERYISPYNVSNLIVDKPGANDFLRKINFSYPLQLNLHINTNNVKLSLISREGNPQFNLDCYFNLSELQYLYFYIELMV